MATPSNISWCEACDDERPSDAAFCQKCGEKVTLRVPEPSPLPEPETPILPSEESEGSAPPKRLSKKQLVIGASLVAALVIAGGTFGVVSVIQQQREEQLVAEAAEAAAVAAAAERRLEAETLLDAFGQDKVLNFLPSCDEVAGLVSADEGKWEAAVSAFVGVNNPREASRVLSTVRSATGTLEDADVLDYSDGFEEGVSGPLEALFASSPRAEGAPAAQIGRWQSEWLTLSREACPAEFDSFNTTYSSLQASAAKFARIITLASQVPWYPEGYSELLAGIAYKWVDVGYDCSSCYQWDMDFVSQSRCNSVYAEVDILDSSGRVVGWTNDTLRSVRPGEVGRLTFQKYSGSGTMSARVSEFNCR